MNYRICHRLVIAVMCFALLCGVMACKSDAFAKTISGLLSDNTIRDGDSFVLSNYEIRLWGIDCPEYKQQCYDKTQAPYPCGLRARNFLTDFTIGKTITCHTVKGEKSGSRLVAKCFIDGQDLAKELVKSGNAIDYEYFSIGYYASEQKYAEDNKLGIWQGSFIEPYIWRKQHNK